MAGVAGALKKLSHTLGFSFRETAVALDAFGCRVAGNPVAQFKCAPITPITPVVFTRGAQSAGSGI